MVTGGEVIVELTNTQLGMSALHSVMPTPGAVMAAVLACVEAKGLCWGGALILGLALVMCKNGGGGLGGGCVSIYTSFHAHVAHLARWLYCE